MTHSQLCRQSLSKHLVEVPVKMAYFDKVFRQRLPTKTLRQRPWDKHYLDAAWGRDLIRSDSTTEPFLFRVVRLVGQHAVFGAARPFLFLAADFLYLR